MTIPATDPLTLLDWVAYTCQCPSHPPRGCAGSADLAVHIHAIGRCGDPGLSADGDRVELRCMPCVATLRVEVADRLAALNRYGRFHCDSCGAPLSTVDDLVRSVQPL